MILEYLNKAGSAIVASILMLFVSCTLGYAQTDTLRAKAVQPVDTVINTTEDEKTRMSYRPTGLRLGVDLSDIIITMADPDVNAYQFNADMDFGRFLLALDGGYAKKKLEEEGKVKHYSTQGAFWRLGADVNFLTEDVDKNALFFGLRYARSYFSESLETTLVADTVWGVFPVIFDEEKRKAAWGEVVAGMRVNVWKNLFLGYTFRYKFGLSVKDDEVFQVYEVPGFGRFDDDRSTFTFDYHVLYRIRFNKK